MSHPIRVRGLKHVDSDVYGNPRVSHPIRVRGLKQIGYRMTYSVIYVASYTGAWIETMLIAMCMAIRV